VVVDTRSTDPRPTPRPATGEPPSTPFHPEFTPDGPPGGPPQPPPLPPVPFTHGDPSAPPDCSFDGLQDTGSFPPDTNGAVGLTHRMVTLNDNPDGTGGMRIQARDGTPVVPDRTLRGFWRLFDLTLTDVFDPRILYDHFDNRWIHTAAAERQSGASSVLVAVSQTSDPTLGWAMDPTDGWDGYRFDVDDTDALWADYPVVGFNQTWVVVGVPLVDPGPPLRYAREELYFFRKSELYAGIPPTPAILIRTEDDTVFQPAVMFDAPAADLDVLAARPTGPDRVRSELQLLRVVDDGLGNPNLALDVTVSSPSSWMENAVDNDDLAAPPPPGPPIQVGDHRIQSVVYRNGSIWASHGIVREDGMSAPRAAVQWWELSPLGTILQRGVIEDPASLEHYYYPSMAVNAAGQAMIGFTRSSPTTFAQAAYVTRACSDPLDTVGDIVVLEPGDQTYVAMDTNDRNRWGDYSATVVDPVDDLRLWTLQELSNGPGTTPNTWTTWWGCVDPCAVELDQDCLPDSDGDTVKDGCDNCRDAANPGQQDVDGDGLGDACDPCTDTDGDGFGNPGYPANSCDVDNCPNNSSPDQTDTDGDGVGDFCDNCDLEENREQEDVDQDLVGDACDNCPQDPNNDQTDTDMDGAGQACDNCLSVPNPDQWDCDSDGRGNACDNCPCMFNPGQQNSDMDPLGDPCDNCPLLTNGTQLDQDRDGAGNVCDNCLLVYNPAQADLDMDGQGDFCDTDRDGDTVPDVSDNCPSHPNAGQGDTDGDTVPDGCDPCPSTVNEPRPGEVPRADHPEPDPLLRPYFAVRLEKDPTNPSDLFVRWDHAVDAERYNIWRGTLDALWRQSISDARYDHQVPFGTLPGDFCNLDEDDPTGSPGDMNRNETLLENESRDALGTWLEFAFYYLVTAERTCPTDMSSADGSFGFADRNADLMDDPFDVRPPGYLPALGCNP
jgi:hypothetical protein